MLTLYIARVSRFSRYADQKAICVPKRQPYCKHHLQGVWGRATPGTLWVAGSATGTLWVLSPLAALSSKLCYLKSARVASAARRTPDRGSHRPDRNLGRFAPAD